MLEEDSFFTVFNTSFKIALFLLPQTVLAAQEILKVEGVFEAFFL